MALIVARTRSAVLLASLLFAHQGLANRVLLLFGLGLFGWQ